MKPILFLSTISVASLTVNSLGSEEELTSEIIPESTLEQVVDKSTDEMSLEEIDQKLNNPLTDLWSMTLQENYSIL